MPRSKPPRRRGHGEIVPPSSKQDRIEELLRIQLVIFPEKELTLEEIGLWARDLNRFDLQAIEWAFEEHRTLAMFFPKPAQIIDLCKTWLPPQKFPPGCDQECQSRHHQGYGETDVLYLWRRYQTVRDSLPNRPLTDGEVNKLLDELDKHRGASPTWRKIA